MRVGLDAFEGYASLDTVQYDDACAVPMGEFERLFGLADLVWNEGMERFVRKNSGHSKDMIDAWRGKVSPEALAALRRGYRGIGLPWYQNDEEW